MTRIGDFDLNRVYAGDCLDVIVTSPPYWGQRISNGTGAEDDPRVYIEVLTERFAARARTLKPTGLLWINIGDASNTPVNWRRDDCKYSSLGPDKAGLDSGNSAHTKPRLKRKAFPDPSVPWLP